MTRKIIGLFACVVLTLTVPVHVEAQGIKGMIKKKVTEQVKGEDKPAETTNSKTSDSGRSTSKYGGDIIEISELVLDDFTKALNVEIGLRADLKRDLAKLKTPEQFRACQQTAMGSPAAQKIAMTIGNIPENASDAEQQKIYLKVNADLKAEVTKQCGADPEETFPAGKRIERMREIETAAAEAFDQAQADRGAARGPAVNEDVVASRKYPILKERITAYCRALDAGSIKSSGNGATFKGNGAGVNWVFSSTESDALTPRCKKLQPLLSQAN